MKKTLVITVPIRTVQIHQGIGELPYGPAVVNGILEHRGYDSTIWDLNNDLYLAFTKEWESLIDIFAIRGYRTGENSVKINKILKWLKRAVKDKFDSVKPDAVLLSVFSSHSLDFLIPLSVLIKEISPDCYVLAGGRGLDNTERRTQMNYADLFSEHLPIDCLYRGDAENDLITVLETRPRGVYDAPPVTAEVLESVPNPSWKGIDFDNYQGYADRNIRMPITASKGCIRECTFCDVKTSWPKFVYRKGEDVAREIINTYNNYGLHKFEFTDNLINGSITNFRAMNQVLANELPDTLDYLGYAICRTKQSMPAEDFKLAARAGAKVLKVGIESGSEKVRNDMKKKFSNEDITWFAENCAENGIRQLWLMFVGYPTETEEDFQASIKLLREHTHLSGSIDVFLSLPMMLTSNSNFMKSHADEYGLEHNRYDSWSDFYWTSTRFADNTFDVRVDRWKRFVDAIHQYGFDNSSQRQQEKMLEIQGIEEIYAQHKQNGNKVIPIFNDTFNVNKETYI